VPVPRFEPLNVLRAAALDRGLLWTTATTGDRLDLDGVEVRVVHPPPPDWERQRVRNDDSIVLELRWHDVSVVLTGDVGSAVERALKDRFAPARIRVLKVPHHGSLTSSTPEFVRALHPQIAVFSAGRSNHFGHPASDVLARYQLIGTQILRTDRHGEIDITTDGYSLNSTTFLHEDTNTNTKDTKT